jgi:hypothetical protein
VVVVYKAIEGTMSSTLQTLKNHPAEGIDKVNLESWNLLYLSELYFKIFDEIVRKWR